MKVQRNQELTKLIGRRLREACASEVQGEIPAAIAIGLAKLEQREDCAAATSDDGADTEDRCPGRPVVAGPAVEEAPGNGAA